MNSSLRDEFTPRAACGVTPLRGAPLAARQSRFRGGLEGASLRSP
jgi:hypothetical protein